MRVLREESPSRIALSVTGTSANIISRYEPLEKSHWHSSSEGYPTRENRLQSIVRKFSYRSAMTEGGWKLPWKNRSQ